MSGKEDDELKREARDEAFARRGAHMLERMHVAAPAVDCLDTEIIAAYADRSLNAEQAAHCEEHFASCAKCRAVLRAMLAAESELASAALNKAETASAGILSPAASASRPSDMGNRVRPPRTDWRLRWLAPAMGIAAALALMIVIRGPWRRAETPNPNVLVAQGPEAKSSQPMGAHRKT
jgi:anti-sigma factor RsiW